MTLYLLLFVAAFHQSVIAEQPGNYTVPLDNYTETSAPWIHMTPGPHITTAENRHDALRPGQSKIWKPSPAHRNESGHIDPPKSGHTEPPPEKSKPPKTDPPKSEHISPPKSEHTKPGHHSGRHRRHHGGKMVRHNKAVSFLKLALVRAGREGSALSLLRAYSRLGEDKKAVQLLFDARMRQAVRQTERLKQLGAVLRELAGRSKS